jgi:eukaryotic-like serine/threonine-protein kinase
MGLIKELCNPDIAARGHPKGIGKHNQYSLERYVSLLDLAAKRLEVQIRIDRQTRIDRKSA